MPSPRDMGDLDHRYYYTWGIDWSVPAGEEITGATLTFYSIWDWRVEEDYLYTHLLEDAAAGLARGRDDEGGGDKFAGQGELIGIWSDPQGGYRGRWAIDLIYEFNAAQVAALAAYAGDGNFGFGVDPDCHYFNRGVELVIRTGAVPDGGATAALLGGSLIALGALRRRQA
jgi:hypothetical protein